MLRIGAKEENECEQKWLRLQNASNWIHVKAKCTFRKAVVVEREGDESMVRWRGSYMKRVEKCVALDQNSLDLRWRLACCGPRRSSKFPPFSRLLFFFLLLFLLLPFWFIYSNEINMFYFFHLNWCQLLKLLFWLACLDCPKLKSTYLVY